ncbi:unnamed protein product [Blepharisma stoltei]|uniref:Uncharacterized protein n=1 Tax=Blepharisma stoltei TaxID=1481888 RepID=A0AAU9IU66_9CILI|nr:unnamed protein product [Blepharisma stoltei]
MQNLSIMKIGGARSPQLLNTDCHRFKNIDQNSPSLLMKSLSQSNSMLDPRLNPGLFKEITEQKYRDYKKLNFRVGLLLNSLEDTMEAVSVRDDCSLQPIPIRLDIKCSRLMNRRRTDPMGFIKRVEPKHFY